MLSPTFHYIIDYDLLAQNSRFFWGEWANNDNILYNPHCTMHLVFYLVQFIKPSFD